MLEWMCFEMTIAVCDDNAVHLDSALRRLSRMDALKAANLFTFSDPNAMLDWLVTQPNLDIAILDIRMERSGIEIAGQINRLYPECQIVFITAYIDYAPQVYDVEHTYLVLKSEMDERLEKAVEKALKKLEKNETRQIAVSFKGQQQLLPIGTVRLIERRGRLTIIRSASGEYQTYERPDPMITHCRDDFLRCHHSFFVNRAWISAVNKEQLVLRDGTAVPMSRTYAAHIRQALLNSALANGGR